MVDEVNYPHALIVCGYDPVYKLLHVDLFRIQISSALFIQEVHSIIQIFGTYNIIINNYK